MHPQRKNNTIKSCCEIHFTIIGYVHYVIDCKNITEHSRYLGEIRTLNGDVMHNEYRQNYFTLAYGITIII